MSLSERAHRVLAIARRVVELERELASLHSELDRVIARDPAGADGERRAGLEDLAAAGAEAAEGGVGGNVQAAVLEQMRARPGQALRAAELEALIGGHAAEGSVASALQRLATRGRIERVGRGEFRFRADAGEAEAP